MGYAYELGKLYLFKSADPVPMQLLSRAWFIKSDGSCLLETYAASNRTVLVSGLGCNLGPLGCTLGHSYPSSVVGYHTVEVVPVEDLPLYISLAYKTVHFMEALKGVGDG